MKRKSPTRSVRVHCLGCMNGKRVDVELCPSKKTCLLWPYRMGKGRVTLAVIREYCYVCIGGSFKEASQCTAGPDKPETWMHQCPLWFYRPGSKPYRGRKGAGVSPERMKVVRATWTKVA